MASASSKTPARGDLVGISRMTVDAVGGVTALVEALHGHIASRALPLGPAPAGRTRGITGLVYRSVRGVTRLVGWGLDAALPPLAPLLGTPPDGPQRQAALAALNGVVGDYLETSRNPLAITMALRHRGMPLVLERQALAEALPQAGPKLLVLVHGLCMNDLQWLRQGHDHGAALARDLGYTPVYLQYNTGRHVDANGEEFSRLMERLLDAWPHAPSELCIVAHSMGGLVARSACAHALQAGLHWPTALKRLVFLGTPHAGAPLERAGSWVDTLLDLSPYTAPFSRLGKLRSAGIQDLRHGHAVDAGVPLPPGVRCYAMAASRQAQAPREPGGRVQGDGLVPVKSALALALPSSRQWVGYGMNHFDLLSRPEAYAQLLRWLKRR